MNGLLHGPDHAFITLFDRHYLARGLLMARSLLAHLPEARLFVVCLDTATEQFLRQHAHRQIEPIALEALEASDPRLPAVKSARSAIEYYFTLAPALPRYLLTMRPELSRVSYLDADLFFYADPTPAFVPVAEAAITAIEHRYSPLWDGTRQCGRFNVGWLSFTRSTEALNCLARWQTQCLDYCPDHPDAAAAVYGDQLYLDEWPARYPNLGLIHHPGANLAPWNVRTHRLQAAAGGITVDGQPLLFFHFHGLKRMADGVWDTSLNVFATRLDLLLRRSIYRPYLQALERAMTEVNSALGETIASSVRATASAAQASWLDRLRFYKRSIKGQYIHV